VQANFPHSFAFQLNGLGKYQSCCFYYYFFILYNHTQYYFNCTSTQLYRSGHRRRRRGGGHSPPAWNKFGQIWNCSGIESSYFSFLSNWTKIDRTILYYTVIFENWL